MVGALKGRKTSPTMRKGGRVSAVEELAAEAMRSDEQRRLGFCVARAIRPLSFGGPAVDLRWPPGAFRRANAPKGHHTSTAKPPRAPPTTQAWGLLRVRGLRVRAVPRPLSGGRQR